MQTQTNKQNITSNDASSELTKQNIQTLLIEESPRVRKSQLLTRNKSSGIFARLIVDGKLMPGLVCCLNCMRILSFPSGAMASSNLVQHTRSCPFFKHKFELETNCEKFKKSIFGRRDISKRSRVLNVYDLDEDDE